MPTVAENIETIRARIAAAVLRAGRAPESVRLVAASKGQSPELLRQALACGQSLFGENYLQEARKKKEGLTDQPGARWHFIGHLQSNKARIAAELFDCIETVDNLRLAGALEKHLAALDKTMPVLVQVNIGREAQKAGVLPEEAGSLCRSLRQFPHLVVQGLMAMPPLCAEPEQSRPFFRRLRELAEGLAAEKILGGPGPLELSMGMSADFEVAVEEGATLVRVGTALFGARECVGC